MSILLQELTALSPTKARNSSRCTPARTASIATTTLKLEVVKLGYALR